MPSGDFSRARRKPARKAPYRPTRRQLEAARAQQRQFVSQGRAVERAANQQRAAARRRPKPAPVFQRPRPATRPIQQAQQRAARRTVRAERRLPQRPAPHVPILRNPTPAQTQAARRIIVRAVNEQAGDTRGRAGQQRRDRVAREMMRDPRFARAVNHYNRIAERQQPRLRRVDTVRASPPRARLGIGPASIAAPRFGRLIGAATSLDTGDLGPRRFVGRVGSDLKDIAVGPFVGAYELGRGAVEAAVPGGAGTERLERLGRGIVEGTAQTVRHPIKSFEEHPLLTPLTFAGIGSVAGRTGGAVARGVGKKDARGIRGRLDRVGSTVRPPLAMSDDAGTKALVQRTYSKDLTRKAVQKARDARREPLRRPDGSVVTTRDRGRDVPVLRATRGERDKALRKEADFAASRANAVERMVREQTARDVKPRVRGRRGQDLVALVVEGTVRSEKTFTADLRSEAARIRGALDRQGAGEQVYRHRGEIEQARDRLALVETALRDPRVARQARGIVGEGERIGRLLNTREKELVRRGVLSSGKRAERARMIHPAIAHMDARHFSPQEMAQLKRAGVDVSDKALAKGALRRSNGQFLSRGETAKMLQAVGRDPETVAYLPARLSSEASLSEARAMHTQFRPGARSVMDPAGKQRTGEAFRRGAVESSADLIRTQGVRQGTQLAKAQQLDAVVERFGARHPEGRYWTAKEAQEAASRLEYDDANRPVLTMKDGERMYAMRAHPDRLSKDTKAVIRGELQGPGVMESLGQRLLNDRIVKDPGADNVVLVPETFVKRLEEHLKPASEIERFLQMVNRPFRFAVLAQPRWLTGNFVEPFIVRLPGRGAGLLNVPGLAIDIAAASKVVKRMERSGDPRMRQAAQEIRAQQFGGLFIGGRGASNRRVLEDTATYGKVVSRVPAVRHLGEFAHKLGAVLMAPGRAYFWANRQAIEQWAQKAAFGKQAREDMQAFTGSWAKTVRLGEKAVDEAAKGLVNTATQRRFMEMQHELLGKYEGFNPRLRAAVQGPLPFLPWALNAARFVFWTMPAHRSAQSALLVQTQQTVKDAWELEHRNTPPGGLRYSHITDKGGHVDLARYTPYGLTTPPAEGELGGITDQLLPQFQGALEAIQGRDPFGRPLRLDPEENKNAEEPGRPSGLQKAGVAGYGLVESMTPYVSMIRRLREQGGTAYSGSTVVDPDVKPGTSHMGAARRTFDPFRPTYLRAPGGAAKDGPAPRLSREERLLERRGRMLERSTQGSARIDEILERRARLLAP